MTYQTDERLEVDGAFLRQTFKIPSSVFSALTLGWMGMVGLAGYVPSAAGCHVTYTDKRIIYASAIFGHCFGGT
jgi:hypothetical protein